MLEHRLATCFLFAAIVGGSPAHADTTFGPGSIIIPASATYQSDCGSVAMYGVVYNMLRANAWLNANGFGKIEVYYANKTTKQSPNRCTPTNRHNGPAYPLVPAPLHDDPKWNDGCDFSVTSTTTVPVKRMTNTTAVTVATDVAPFSTVDTSAKTAGGTATFPNWPSRTVQFTGVPANDVSTIRYWGGSFVVNDADAVTLRRLIQGTLIANDVDGNPINFTVFRSGACTFPTSPGAAVNFHVAQASFTAPTPKIFTAPPPRLALLESDDNNRTGNITNGLLQKYLNSAGLNFNGAQGCPIGGHNATNNPGSCPSPNKTGQIYDLFDFEDLLANRLAVQVAGQPVYKMFWAPHWDVSGATPNANEQNAIAKIALFADGQAGVLAECASIETFEGTPSGFNAPSAAHPPGQFQTCQNSAGVCGGTVTAGFTKNSATPLGNNLQADPQGVLRNCSDPNQTTGADCVYFSSPADSFIQIADYRWHASANSGGSQVADWKPNAGAIYKPSVQTLISGVTNLDLTKVANPVLARTMITGDMVTRSLKDNDPAKSNILYLGNHDQTSSVAGTKVVLQTLLQLGDPPSPPVIEEVVRSTPIVALLNTTPTPKTALVQGTYDEVTPPDTTTSIVTDADAATFRFPYLIGHLRAVDTSTISTGGTAIQATTNLFDATDLFNGYAGGVNPAGCGGPPFNFQCRQIFTNAAATGFLPPSNSAPVPFTAGGSSHAVFGPTMGTHPTLNPATHDTLVSRIYAGFELTPGNFVARLGGVDRSAVAVIEASLVVPALEQDFDNNPTPTTPRPKMIYFGAADGMLHAVCGDNVNPPCNGKLGKELWAYLPRKMLPRMRMNTQVIQGSPFVADMFGDFDGNGSKRFHTLLFFQTGSGNPAIATEAPAVYALDISNPASPKIVMEYATPAVRGTIDFGQGLTVTTGRVQVGAATKNLVFVQTNNGGTSASAGTMVTAVDVETGTVVWSKGHAFPAPRVAASGPVPPTGVPKGAVSFDLASSGRTTHVAYNTLYGDIYVVDATNGENKIDLPALPAPPGTPLFRFTTDLKPFGAQPAVFVDSGQTYVASASGGYFDPVAAALWSTNAEAQQVVVVNVGSATGNIDENDTPSPGGLKFVSNLGLGDKSFSQIQIIGNQLFVTTDVVDVNQTGYGNNNNTGHVYGFNITDGSAAAGFSSPIVVQGGAGSIANNGSTLISAAGDSYKTLTTSAPTPASQQSSAKVTRKLWLRTL